MHLRTKTNISFRDYDNELARMANDDIQTKVERIKEDISNFIIENNKELGIEPDRLYDITDRVVSFQPIPFLYSSKTGQVEFACDDINFWLMVTTYELYKRSTELSQRQQSMSEVAL